MQGNFQIFELFAPGLTARNGVQKLTVKVPAGQGGMDECDASGFMEIMNALLGMPADQLQASMEQLDWVSIEREGDQSAAWIDLTQADPEKQASLKWILSAMNDRTAQAMQCVSADTAGIPGQNESVAEPDAPKNGSTEAALQSATEADEASAETAFPRNQDKPTTATQSQETTVEKSGARQAPSQKPFQVSLTDGEKASTTMNKKTNTTQSVANKADVVDQSSAKTPFLTEDIKHADPNSQSGVETGHQNKTSKATGPVTQRLTQAQQLQANPQPADNASFSENADTPKKDPIHKWQQDLGSLSGREEPSGEVKSDGTQSNVTQTGSTFSKEEQHHALSSRLGPSSTEGAENPASEKQSPLPTRDMQTDVIRQIVQRMNLRNERTHSQMNIRLKPEFLGNLRLQISTENHHVMIRMTAESPAVKEMIEHNLQFLKTELQQHGLQIDKFDVYVGQGNNGWQQRRQQTASHQNQHGFFRSERKFQQAGDTGSVSVPSEVTANARRSGVLNDIDFFA